jgi:hypothetical protein
MFERSNRLYVSLLARLPTFDMQVTSGASNFIRIEAKLGSLSCREGKRRDNRNNISGEWK